METNASSSAIDTDASVAQPAPIIALHNSCSRHRTSPPAVQGPTHKLAFYNVGWQPTSNAHTAAWLTREVHDIVTNGNVDAIGISEVFNIRNDLNDMRNDIMSQLLGHLNQGSAERPAWEGKTDVHYIFMWKPNSLHLLDYEVVSCGVNTEPYRRGQYFQFQPTGSAVPLHVYHNHSPSPRLTLAKKKTIMKTFWRHVMTKSSVAQPGVVFGGDYNCKIMEWTICMSNYSSIQTVQTCQSNTALPRTGDTALVVNAIAFQEESGFGKSYNRDAFSDAHDVVLVPLCLCSSFELELELACAAVRGMIEEARASAEQPEEVEQVQTVVGHPVPRAEQPGDTNNAAMLPRGHRAPCCIICEDRCIDVLCQPCGHLVLCRPCGDRVQLHDNRCPTCRQPLQKLQRVYGR